MVRDLQILPEIPIIPTGSGMRHIATSYEVGRSPYFETVGNNVRKEEDIIVSNLEDTVNLNRYTTQIAGITEDTELYARFKLHFTITTSDGTRRADSGWSSVVNLKGDMEGFKVSDVILATPRLFITKDSTGTRDVIKIESSPMEVFIGYGNHDSTTWTITDSDSKILFQRKYSKELLTELAIDEADYAYNKVFIIKCQHHSTTNATSNPGVYVYNAALDQRNLYTLTPESELIAGRKLLTSVVLHINRFISIDIVIKNKEDTIISESLNNTNLCPKVNIPADIVDGEIYYIWSRIQYEAGLYSAWQLDAVLVGKSNKILDINPNTEYEDGYLYSQKIIQPGVKYLMSKELVNQGGFVLPKSDTEVFKGLAYYRVESGLLTYIDDIQGTENVGSNKPLSNWSTNIVPLYNGDVIINRTELQSDKDKEGLGKSVFLKYEVDTQNVSFTLKGSANPIKQLGSTGVSGSMVATIDNNIYYIPHKEGTFTTPTKLALYKLDTNTMTTSKEMDLPFEAFSYVSMCLLSNKEFLVLGGVSKTELDKANPKDMVRTNQFIYKYNIDTQEFTKIGDLSTSGTSSWYNVHAVMRKDGKVAIFNNSEGAGVAENQKIILFDPKTETVTDLNNDFDDGRMYLRTLVADNGNIYRISSAPLDPQEVYIYKTKGYANVSNGTADIQTNVITDLVVPAGRTVVIDNPYKYTTITIEGKVDDGTTGTLVWVSGTKRTEYKADTLFITKTMVLYNDNVDELTKDKKWKNIVLLDGVHMEVNSGNQP
nr:MAG TPA: thiocyanate forming protein system [Caudoviricetes sp.]